MASEEENSNVSEPDTLSHSTVPQEPLINPLQKEEPLARQDTSPSSEHEIISDVETLPNIPVTDAPLVYPPVSETPRWEYTSVPGGYQQSRVVPPLSSTLPRRRLPRSLTLGLIVLLLLVLLTAVYALVLRPRIPAASATIRITPTSRTVVDNGANTFTATIGDASSANNPIGTHRIARTTASQSMKVPATGKGHQDATTAQGKVSVSILQGHTSTSILTNYYLTSSSGVKIVIEGLGGPLIPLSGSTVDYSAYADNPGASGNIPAYDINGTFVGVQDPSLILSIQNTQPFTGGQDASDYTFVQQSDIDTATTTLNNNLTNAVSAVQSAVQGQLASGEQFMNGVQCNPHVTSNHKGNDRASDVTVTVASECAGIAYSTTKLTDFATTQLSQSAASQFGAQYALVGQVEAQIPSASVTGDTVAYILSARGIWVFQVTDSVKQHFATLISGKPQDDATALLSKQPGVSAVNVQTSGGLGTAVPSSKENIQINVSNVKGL